jgi:hypothetical protein
MFLVGGFSAFGSGIRLEPCRLGTLMDLLLLVVEVVGGRKLFFPRGEGSFEELKKKEESGR